MSLRRQLILLAALVALVSVAFTGLTMFGLYRQGATEAASTALRREAGTTAAALSGLTGRRPARAQLRARQLDRQLGKRQIVLSVVAANGTDVDPPFAAADVTASRQAGQVTAQRELDGTDWLVAGVTDGDVTVLLGQPLDQAVTDSRGSSARLLLSLVAGLAAGAVAGAVLARRLSRPLSRVAAGARGLSAGRRDVQVEVEGPAEVADLARALNDLDVALRSSEARQRRFLLDVSHELRTPLTAVTGYAEGLADGVIPAAEIPAAAAVIQQEAARLGRRVDDLMALARLEADDFRLELASADLGLLVSACAQAWSARAAVAGVQLSAAPSPVPVITDAERLRQSLDALVDNALRVLPPGSTIRLACGSTPSTAWLEVTDDGPGLAEDDLAVAFERGRLTDRYRGERPVGSGLGLALVGELARRLGGTARAGRSSAGGAAFRIDLPLDPEPDRQDPNTPRTFG